jgi:UDP-galactopyranose mutase
MKYDYLVVGAGFAGAVCAERLASCGNKILLIDSRNHIGGNAYDKYDESGILIHPYGPHIFHTNSKKVFEYLSRFTNWRFYEHRVRSVVSGAEYPFPINRNTVNQFFGLNLNESEVEDFFQDIRIPKKNISNSEDLVLSSVGRDLCDAFFRGYTNKQWGMGLKDLSVGVAARIPIRSNDDDRYFADFYQFMPDGGYTKLFEAMLASSNIEIRLSTTYEEVRLSGLFKKIIYTGQIDNFFNYIHGRLPYRSIRFEHEHFRGQGFFQSVGTINYPNDHDYTRITEFKHLTGQKINGTSIVKEFPTDIGDPFYPIPRKENEALYKKYKKLAESLDNVFFVGRLAQYKYYNMDQVVAASLALVDKINEN